MKKLLEIAVFSPEGAIIAAEAGADRIELCSGYAEGGLTPSSGAVKMAKANGDVPVFVMVRPRAGDFFYRCTEIEVMRHDISEFKTLGADGIVLGILNDDFSVNEKVLAEFVQLAAPLPVTFHRAFDLCYDPFAALETLIRCGVKRVLTSGQKSSAQEGASLLKELQRKANGRITILAGAGVTPANIVEIAAQTGCHEFHASAKRIVPSGDSFGFGENVLPHPELIAQLKEKLL